MVALTASNLPVHNSNRRAKTRQKASLVTGDVAHSNKINALIYVVQEIKYDIWPGKSAILP
jgi:hypothetical protein